MSAGFSTPYWSILLAAFTVAGLMGNSGQAQGTPRPRRSLELSETNSAEILTNLNQLATKKDGLNQLEDQLQMLKQISARNPLEGRFSAPYVPPSSGRALPNKTIKDLLERKNNWGLTAEELGTAVSPSGSDPFAAYNEEKLDPKGASLEQFYDALNRGANGKQNSRGLSDNASGASAQKPIFRDNSDPSQDPSLPAGIRDKAQKLQDVVTTDPGSIFNPTRTQASFENFFGLNGPSAAPDGLRAPQSSMESFMEQFKKVLEGPSQGTKLDPALSSLLPDAAGRRSTPYQVQDQFSAPKHDDLIDSTPRPATALVDRSTIPDFNSAVLNQWNPLYTTPKVELPKISPPTPPNFDFPRRKF